MELSRLKELAAGGKIFSVLFTKRTDGQDRRMVCRTGVSKDLTGMDRAYDPETRGLLTVYDMQKKAYRMIPADSIREIKVRKQTITF